MCVLSPHLEEIKEIIIVSSQFKGLANYLKYLSEGPGSLLDFELVEKHYETLKQALKIYHGEDLKKLYTIFIMLSYFIKIPKQILVRGDSRGEFVEALTKLIPDDFFLEYEGTREKELYYEKFNDKKLFYIKNFQANKKWILNNYIRNEKDHFHLQFIKKDTLINKEITKVTIISTVGKTSLEGDFEKKAVIVDLNDTDKQVDKLIDYKASQSKERYEHDKLQIEINNNILEIKDFLKSLDCNFEIEVPFASILKSYFYIGDSKDPFLNFLDLIKVITFFHQKKRNWYESTKTGKRYLIAHTNDLIYALIILRPIYIDHYPTLSPAKREFFNFVLTIAKNRRKNNKFFSDNQFLLSKIPVKQSEITQGYKDLIHARIKRDKNGDLRQIKGSDSRIPGKSTLIRWLNDFCERELLLKEQEKKNAKISYFIKGISRINPSEVIEMIKESSNAITKREHRLEIYSQRKKKDDDKIILHRLDLGGEKN